MKRLMMTVIAGAFLLLYGAAANAFTGSNDYIYGNSIDSSGTAVIAMHSPSASLWPVTHDRVSLDVTGVMAVNNLGSVNTEAALVPAKDTGSSMLYCFDSINRFCALRD